MKRFCFACDLVDNQALINEYIDWHKRVWPEIRQSIVDSGIKSMEIYHVGDRMFMVMETDDEFTLENKARMDAENPRVQEWEQLMWKYQKALPFANRGEKWMLMERIYNL